ncbi:Las1-like-domain-containing protein [Syncephalis fuscata]|nr:Las1-like-domain-containing protein [Syncephalis fuscata]
MTPRLPRVVPWSSLEEYEQIAQWLFAPDPNYRQQAVHRVRAWLSRGKVPHAVDCTATLVELGLLVDRCSTSPQTALVSPKELRLMLSMALIRFVNGFVDAHQQGIYALSVSAIAEQLGMPSWFVELRHAGTHEQLPSLSVLRSTCAQALHWLYTNYWSLQRSYLQETVGEIRPLLLEYKDLRKKSVKANKATLNKLAGEETRLLRSMASLVDADTFEDTLVPILLEVGILVPMGKKKRAALPDIQIAKDIYELWSPALAHFSRTWSDASFLEALIQAMLDQLEDTEISTFNSLHTTIEIPVKPKSISYTWTLVAWIKVFIQEYYNSDNTTDGLAPSQLDDLLEYCLRHPNRYTLHLLHFMNSFDDQLASTVAPLLDYIKKLIEPVKLPLVLILPYQRRK